MDVVDISRWQFGITTVYHFIFVPLTIGLAPLVALMQTIWVTTKKTQWYRATRFFGTIFLINFAMGVATGIVQEFQFGMNWSEYSRMVGDIFGGPLALEALIAFFLESTFLGLWIFGWGKIPVWMHTASIWIVALATNLSAYFIIVANSFMQHPVGAIYNPETHRAELTDIGALLTNSTALAAFPHAVMGSFLTAGTLILGVSGWWFVRAAQGENSLPHGGGKHRKSNTGGISKAFTSSSIPHAEAEANRAALSRFSRSGIRMGLWTILLSTIGLAATGDAQGKLMFVQQPMKMASAESLCHSQTDPMFSVLTIGTHNNCESVVHLIELPWVLPFLAKNQFTGVHLEGVKELQEQDAGLYGSGGYAPNLFVTYWSFRAMIGLLALSLALAVFAWFATRHKSLLQGKSARIFSWCSLIAIPAPFLGNSAGWIFTEMGRQPWIVHPNPDNKGNPDTEGLHMTVQQAVSNHPAWMVFLTLIVFTLLYLALFLVWFWLIKRVVRHGPPTGEPSPADIWKASPIATVGADGEASAEANEPIRFALSTSSSTSGEDK